MLDNALANTQTGQLTTAILVQAGIQHVVISPGSRSTPLAVACLREKALRAKVILDERSAGFFALGLARSTSRPVALVCTSGSAVANYLPAVVEAYESRQPLILLTADRPPELRNCQAGQTINQTRIFGTFAVWYEEAPVPDGSLPVFESWVELLTQAILTARIEQRPVHLNCPFREPLGGHRLPDPVPVALKDRLVRQENVVGCQGSKTTLPLECEAGWIVAGPAQPEDPQAYVQAVKRVSEGTGWPILADALNPCRHFLDTFKLEPVAHYDALLRSDELAVQFKPAAILQLGPLPTGKVLRQRLTEWALPTWIVGKGASGWNASRAPASFVETDIEELEVLTPKMPPADAAKAFVEASKAWKHQLDAVLVQNERREPRLACLLLEASPPKTPIYVASSMPVRDAEWFWPVNSGQRPIYFNRGANGIDGTLSTALGVAEGAGRPAILYTGDLALLHDSNGFLAAQSAFSGSLTIVCINNQGGGIFHHLPIASEADVFETLFATPQIVDLKTLASAYSIEHREVCEASTLIQLLNPLPQKGVRLLEIKTDRKEDAAFRKSLFRTVRN